MVRGLFSNLFKKLTPAEKIARAVSRNRMPQEYLQNIENISNQGVREGLTEYISVFANKTGREAQWSKAYINEITYKLEMCEDSHVRSAVEDLLSGIKGENSRTAYNKISQSEVLLDSVNTAEGKYCTLFEGEYGNYWYHPNSEPRTIFKLMQENKNTRIKPEVLSKETKINSLREYIYDYPEDKENATYLWKKYFVSKQDTGTQKILNEIYETYGVRICMVENVPREKLIYIKKELEMWQNACNGTAKFPELLDLRTDSHIVINHLGGYMRHQKVVVTEANIVAKGFKRNILRHELGHVNDKNALRPKDRKPESRFKKFCRKLGIMKKLEKTNKYNEYKRAGSDHIEYALTNASEGRAVFCEGDMTKYSTEFKESMIKGGLNPGVVNLKPISYTKCRMLAKFPGKKNEKWIEDLEKAFGGEIPEDILVDLKRSDIKYIKSILKRLKKDEVLTVETFKKALENKQDMQQRFQIEA